MSNELVSATDLKARVVNKVREEIGNLIPEEALNKVIEEAKQEFLNELKDETKKLLKKEYESQIASFQSFIRTTEWSSTLQMSVYANLQQHMKECGHDEYSLSLQNGHIMAMQRMVDALRQSGIHIPY